MSLMMYWFMRSLQGLTALLSSKEFSKYEILSVAADFSLHIHKAQLLSMNL